MLISQTWLFIELEPKIKPDLLDLENNGSHADTTPKIFRISEAAQEPYLEECVMLEQQNQDMLAPEFFLLLIKLGKVG
ncbi:MAG: triphosphoribosyl-dephospho-CoA synthase [Eggerthellaceae bacterium]|nr:triphosphoribosyl-dephospho-CoA synthase [Eggerthellaceae bacterium]